MKAERQLHLVLSCDLKRENDRERRREERRKGKGREKIKGKNNPSFSQAHIPKYRLKTLNVQ